MNCPICGGVMRKDEDGKYLVCVCNRDHKILIDRELARYESGEKDLVWLRFRMRVRVGKILQYQREKMETK